MGHYYFIIRQRLPLISMLYVKAEEFPLALLKERNVLTVHVKGSGITGVNLNNLGQAVDEMWAH